MKEYHTKIDINASQEKVWNVLTDLKSYSHWNPLVSSITGNLSEGGRIKTTIVPLQNTFEAVLLSFKENKEIVWKGNQIASFLLAGEHGEYFTGILSVFISKKLQEDGKGFCCS
jgi:hypothetical protein